MKKTTKKSLLNLSWIPYVLILFEMLYMASPFAVFFYGVYKFPLDFLASHKQTAWLVLTVFPHFSQSSSAAANILLSISVPFMIAGLMVFSVSFAQIYYAKFAKKGAVTNGIYSIIRHPQYTSWTLFGLGMSIFWSRLIVWLMFLAMTFIYYFLARAEEKECMEKFPESYAPYYEITGMFFPKIKFLKIKSLNILPAEGIKRKVSIAVIFASCCVIIMFSGMAMRNNVINSLSASYGENYFSLSLTELDESKISDISSLVMDNADVKNAISENVQNQGKLLVYIIPEEWGVSELGVETMDLNPMANVQTHGNAEEKNPNIKKILISKAVLYQNTNDDSKIMNYAVRQKPFLMAKINIEKKEVTDIVIGAFGNKFGEIPVPLY